jgi:hypothetical protein
MSTDRIAIEGGCFCGSIRYRIEPGDYRAGNCHCTMCRRIHAAPHVAWLVVPAARFSYSKGEPVPLRSSPAGSRYFCQACGTHIACTNDSHPEIVDVTLCSLDEPTAHVPDFEVFTDTRLPWPGLPPATG